MFKRIKIFLFASLLVVLCALTLAFLVNYLLLQTKMNKVLSEDSRNDGLDVSLHYHQLFNYKQLVVNYKSTTPPATPLSIFRCLFQIAHTFSDNKFTKIIIAYHGKPKVTLDGESFDYLGNQYGSSAESMNMLLYLATNIRHLNGGRVLPGSQSHYTALLEKRLAENGTFSVMQNEAADSLFSTLSKHN